MLEWTKSPFHVIQYLKWNVFMLSVFPWQRSFSRGTAEAAALRAAVCEKLFQRLKFFTAATNYADSKITDENCPESVHRKNSVAHIVWP